jgi:hypothetical protein
MQGWFNIRKSSMDGVFSVVSKKSLSH